jgi:hypothetical protein
MPPWARFSARRDLGQPACARGFGDALSRRAAGLRSFAYSNPKAGHQLPSDFGCDETKPVTKSHCETFGCRLADEKQG